MVSVLEEQVARAGSSKLGRKHDKAGSWGGSVTSWANFLKAETKAQLMHYVPGMAKDLSALDATFLSRGWCVLHVSHMLFFFILVRWRHLERDRHSDLELECFWLACALEIVPGALWDPHAVHPIDISRACSE